MIDTKNLIWFDIDKAKQIPKKLNKWLLEDSSLTYKLKQKYPDFRVKVVNEVEKTPYDNEIPLLNISNNTNVIIRKVLLFGNSKAVVFARSIIPKTKDTKRFNNIGSKPLGEILFDTKDIIRTSIELCHNSEDIWGRRSIFKVNNTNILVSEFFLDNLFDSK